MGETKEKEGGAEDTMMCESKRKIEEIESQGRAQVNMLRQYERDGARKLGSKSIHHATVRDRGDEDEKQVNMIRKYAQE